MKYFSPADSHAYATYCVYCADVDVEPVSFPVWLLLTKNSLIALQEAFAWKMTFCKDKNINAEAPMRKAITKRDRHIIHDLLSQLGSGFSFGELRKGGGLGGVRHQTGAIYGGGCITFRTCRTCTALLPAGRFSKQKKSIRAICKRCDSAKRVERRRAAKKVN